MKILHIDIETSPNVAHVWGLWQQNVGLPQLLDSSYTMCFAAKWHGERKVIFRSVNNGSKKAMLEKCHGLLCEADAVVHFNGTKFDIPVLNKEFVLSGMAPPDPFHQIDLLKVAKQRFRFPSNKLDYVVKALGLGEKEKHAGHELWVKCMAGNKAAWREMKAYNIQDVRLLESLYLRLLPWIKNHPNHALYTDEERPVCTNCGSTHVKKCGTETTKVMTYQRYRCKDCGTPLRGRHSILTKEKKRAVLTQSKL